MDMVNTIASRTFMTVCSPDEPFCADDAKMLKIINDGILRVLARKAHGTDVEFNQYRIIDLAVSFLFFFALLLHF